MGSQIKPLKNIILLSLDAMRFDCVGHQDKYFLKRHNVSQYLDTTEFDRIVDKGISFTQAISVSSYTTSSHASIFTGCYPPRHGIRRFFSERLSSNVATLAEYLKKAGFVTIHASDEMDLFKYTGLNRGADYVIERDDKRVFQIISKNRDKQIFLFAHFFDIHEPYCPRPTKSAMVTTIISKKPAGGSRRHTILL